MAARERRALTPSLAPARLGPPPGRPRALGAPRPATQASKRPAFFCTAVHAQLTPVVASQLPPPLWGTDTSAWAAETSAQRRRCLPSPRGSLAAALAPRASRNRETGPRASRNPKKFQEIPRNPKQSHRISAKFLPILLDFFISFSSFCKQGLSLRLRRPPPHDRGEEQTEEVIRHLLALRNEKMQGSKQTAHVWRRFEEIDGAASHWLHNRIVLFHLFL